MALKRGTGCGSAGERDKQIMTKVEFKKPSGPLSEYAENARKDPIIVIKRGKPLAAVIPLRNADEETIALSTSRKFENIIERSRTRVRREGAISASKLRRRLAPAK
jgi:antitoxin (DNA-binding transcriptional repressor) of toxin-antitoxin stability system